jgi:flagellin
MGLTINSNIPALGAGRQAQKSAGLLTKTLKQLSTGLRINQAADDAAGLAIAEQFATQIRAGQVEVNSLQSGINVTQTAEGGLGVQQDAVQRIRELSLQAANGTLSDENRAALNQEAQQLLDQIGDVATDTQFNGQTLLSEDTTIDLGTQGGGQVSIQESTPDSLGIAAIDLSTAAGATAAANAADAALGQISQNQANLGAQQNRLSSAINQRETSILAAQESESQIRDLDVAAATIELTRNNLLLQGSLSTLVQSNVNSQSALRLLGN